MEIRMILEERKLKKATYDAVYRMKPEYKAKQVVRMTEPKYKVKHAAAMATYFAKNKAKKAAYDAKYAREHPEELCLRTEKHRALKYANTPISELLTSTEWLAILAEANGHCAYCGKEAKLTLDHVIPLSRGGKHSIANVVPACEHCNKSKGNKTLEEWVGLGIGGRQCH